MKAARVEGFAALITNLTLKETGGHFQHPPESTLAPPFFVMSLLCRASRSALMGFAPLADRRADSR